MKLQTVAPPQLNTAPATRPLRVMFALTSMPVGGAETLLVNLLRAVDRSRIAAEVCCLKAPGPWGERIAAEFPLHANFIRHKADWRVVGRLARLMRARQVDALVTVGAGDKMFWGRIAAYLAGVPVIASALHSTGWPDGIGRLNRLLTPITDAFIAVARAHGKFLIEQEQLPDRKVFVIPNGVDTRRFMPPATDKHALRRRLGLPMGVPLCCIVAALRPEKNHHRFIRIAAHVRQLLPCPVEFLIIGDGPLRAALAQYSASQGLTGAVHFLGSRDDVDEILPACDTFMLTSDNEACPVSIMEAMACGLPVVAPDVGSIHNVVIDKRTGFVIEPTDERQFAYRLAHLLDDAGLATRLGTAGRQRIVDCGSLESMVAGYQDLLERLYLEKRSANLAGTSWEGPDAPPTRRPALEQFWCAKKRGLG